MPRTTKGRGVGLNGSSDSGSATTTDKGESVVDFEVFSDPSVTQERKKSSGSDDARKKSLVDINSNTASRTTKTSAKKTVNSSVKPNGSIVKVNADAVDHAVVQVEGKVVAPRRHHHRRPDAHVGSLVLDEETSGGGRLFLGGRHVAQNATWITEQHIEAIVNVTSEVPCYFNDLDRRRKAGVEHVVAYLQIRVTDAMDQNLIHGSKNQWTKILEFVQVQMIELKRSVLVHCAEGRSRSVTVVTALLMALKNWSLQQAYEHVQRCHKVADVTRNLGFQIQLQSFERKLRGTTTTYFIGDRSQRLGRAARSDLESPRGSHETKPSEHKSPKRSKLPKTQVDDEGTQLPPKTPEPALKRERQDEESPPDIPPRSKTKTEPQLDLVKTELSFDRLELPALEVVDLASFSVAGVVDSANPPPTRAQTYPSPSPSRFRKLLRDEDDVASNSGIPPSPSSYMG